VFMITVIVVMSTVVGPESDHLRQAPWLWSVPSSPSRARLPMVVNTRMTHSHGGMAFWMAVIQALSVANTVVPYWAITVPGHWIKHF
jgi:hypothetical protein